MCIAVLSIHILNYDETNFADDLGKKQFLIKRGVKYPNVLKDLTKTSVSVMFCISVDGN